MRANSAPSPTPTALEMPNAEETISLVRSLARPNSPNSSVPNPSVLMPPSKSIAEVAADARPMVDVGYNRAAPHQKTKPSPDVMIAEPITYEAFETSFQRKRLGGAGLRRPGFKLECNCLRALDQPMFAICKPAPSTVISARMKMPMFQDQRLA